MSNKKDKRLSWEETYKEMACEREYWNDLDTVLADGLDKEHWCRSGLFKTRNGADRRPRAGRRR